VLDPGEKSGEKDYRAKIRNEIINKSMLPLALTACFIFIIYLFYNNFATGGSVYNKVILPLVFMLDYRHCTVCPSDPSRV